MNIALSKKNTQYMSPSLSLIYQWLNQTGKRMNNIMRLDVLIFKKSWLRSRFRKTTLKNTQFPRFSRGYNIADIFSEISTHQIIDLCRSKCNNNSDSNRICVMQTWKLELRTTFSNFQSKAESMIFNFIGVKSADTATITTTKTTGHLNSETSMWTPTF